MKKIFIVLVLIILTLWFFRFKLSHVEIIGHVLEFSKIEITTSDELSNDKILVELSNSKTDYSEMVIFENDSYQTIPESYGENDWYVRYDSLWTTFRHYKTNDWHDHLYKFHFEKVDSLVVLHVNIIGPNPSSFKTVIKDAEKRISENKLQLKAFLLEQKRRSKELKN